MLHNVGSIVGAGGRLFEGETGMTSITSAVSTGLSNVQSDAMSLISTVLPYALGLLGAVMVVTIGIKVFRRITGR